MSKTCRLPVCRIHLGLCLKREIDGGIYELMRFGCGVFGTRSDRWLNVRNFLLRVIVSRKKGTVSLVGQNGVCN